MSAWDRLTEFLASLFTGKKARTYQAASSGRRTSEWGRDRGDVNALLARAGPELRLHARDLIRNNAWAKHGQDVIANNTVGWGITPRPASDDKAANARALELWNAWAVDSTEVDSEGRSMFAGILSLAMKAIASDGEVLVRRRYRRPSDGLVLPLQIQMLEADFLDTSKDGESASGGKIINGVEFDKLGRRAAYWLFEEHPGSGSSFELSKRVPAKDILHVFLPGRTGQARGVSWFASAIVSLKDLGEYEDAELMKQKIAACFAAFVTDADGLGTAIGEEDEDDDTIEQFEPGMVANLPSGKQVTVANPPGLTSDTLPIRNLRKVAAGLGIAYEDLTGDYSQVNFSSARMARLAHLGCLRSWQWNMLIPQLCAGVWTWAMEAAVLTGQIKEIPRADWTVSPLPLIEPDKEARAYKDLVRIGAMTPDDMVREQGGDPAAHWEEYAANMKKLDDLKIKLDCDVRAVSAAGLTQERVGLAGGKPPPGEEAPEDEAPPAQDEENAAQLSPAVEAYFARLSGVKQ